MPILNYSTEVPPERTVAEITQLLVRKGARSITTDYAADNRITAVTFLMVVGENAVRFQLPANVDGVARAMLRDKPWNSSRHRGGKAAYERKVEVRARWVAWRILKDWCEAQIALIESGQADVAQVFMPYAVEVSGRTMYELFVETNQRQLSAG